MQNIVILATCILIFVLGACALAPKKANLQQRFPLGMVTNDYGVLSEDDLNFYEMNGQPNPLGGEITNFAYWICAPTSHIRFKCNDFGRPNDINEEHLGEPEIFIHDKTKRYHFAGRRAFPIQGCVEKVDLWNALASMQNHLCVSGYQAGPETNSNGLIEFTFVYDRIKSHSGCDSWFDGGCQN